MKGKSIIVADRKTGIVKRYNAAKGYGFIKRDTGGNGADLFVHKNAIRNTGRRSLEVGQRVKFSVRQGKKGLQADDVFILT